MIMSWIAESIGWLGTASAIFNHCQDFARLAIDALFSRRAKMMLAHVGWQPLGGKVINLSPMIARLVQPMAWGGA